MGWIIRRAGGRTPGQTVKVFASKLGLGLVAVGWAPAVRPANVPASSSRHWTARRRGWWFFMAASRWWQASLSFTSPTRRIRKVWAKNIRRHKCRRGSQSNTAKGSQEESHTSARGWAFPCRFAPASQARSSQAKPKRGRDCAIQALAAFCHHHCQRTAIRRGRCHGTFNPGRGRMSAASCRRDSASDQRPWNSRSKASY